MPRRCSTAPAVLAAPARRGRRCWSCPIRKPPPDRGVCCAVPGSRWPGCRCPRPTTSAAADRERLLDRAVGAGRPRRRGSRPRRPVCWPSAAPRRSRRCWCVPTVPGCPRRKRCWRRPPPGQPRKPTSRAPGSRTSLWFRMNLGRRQNADPRWLLPLICRRGHITKQRDRRDPHRHRRDACSSCRAASPRRFMAAVKRTASSERCAGRGAHRSGRRRPGDAVGSHRAASAATDQALCAATDRSCVHCGR